MAKPKPFAFVLMPFGKEFDGGGHGIDIRMESMGCVGIFIDASYNWIEDSDSHHDDVTLVRAGFKIPF